MTAKKAAQIAMCNPDFVKHHTKVQAANIQYAINPDKAEKTACLMFWVDGECFYYGFDGCEVKLGKYGRTKANWLAEQGYGLVIRNPSFA